MKVLIDTNVLISASLFPNSVPSRAFLKAVSYPYAGIVCEQNIDELKEIYRRKFADRMDSLNRFLLNAMLSVEIVRVPIDEEEDEKEIRDVKDKGILRAAIRADADYLISGDKDFLEANIKHPKILSPADFLKL